MDSRLRHFLSMVKWPFLVAVLAAAVLALVPGKNSAPVSTPAALDVAAAPRVDMREAMRILHDEHGRVTDQADRQRAQTEQQAAEDAYAFEQARLAAAAEAARKLAEQRALEQRAADQRLAEQRNAEKRTVEASIARKPKMEPEAAGAPLDIAPAGESGPLVSEPRGPIESVVAKVGDVAGEIKNKAVATVTGIKDWLSSAGDRLLGR